MPNQNNSDRQELEELLRQMDELLAPPEEEEDFDVEAYAPQDLEDDEPILYQNYSNRYGADMKNFSNGYGTGASQSLEQELDSVPAYNADFRSMKDREYLQRRDETQKIVIPRERPAEPDLYEDPEPVIEKKKKKPRRRKRRGMGCLTSLLVFVLAVVLIFSFVFQPPKSDHSIGSRKRDTATILLCGTDWEGARTDTMMLLYLSGSEHKVGLLSLPRDTLTITSAGNRAKLNSAYGRNGYGEKGMEGLLDYVQEIIGYRPDGYMLINMDLVPQIVDVMGGVDVDVPMSFDLEGEHLEKGYQHLTGNQVLQLLRFRAGYATQDLGRVEVQRKVISACLDQWFTLDHVKDVSAALELVENHSLSTLNVRNYLWVAKTVLLSMGDMSTDTLPGYADYIGDVSYYILDRNEVADMINESYNPYKVEILPENLKIAG